MGEISGYLMLAVYKMFRLVYGAGPKNTSSMFGVKKNLYGGYSDAAMHIAESNVKAILAGEDMPPGRAAEGHQRLCHDDRKPFAGLSSVCHQPAEPHQDERGPHRKGKISFFIIA